MSQNSLDPRAPPLRRVGVRADSLRWILWPPFAVLSASLAAGAILQSGTALAVGLIVACAFAAGWTGVLLHIQNSSPSRPKESREELGWSRARAVTWCLLAVAVAGVILVSSRLYSGVAAFLVPSSDFQVSELIVLGLTIAILAILTRHTAVSSAVQAGKLSEEVRDAVNQTATAIRELRESIRDLSVQVSHLALPATPRPRLRTSLAFEKGRQDQGMVMWTAIAETEGVRGASITVTIDGRSGSAVGIPALAPGQSTTGYAASPGQLQDSGQIVLISRIPAAAGGDILSTDSYNYYKEKNWIGGLKNVHLSRS